MSSIKMRAAVESDMSMIYSAWLKSGRTLGVASDVLNEVYFDEHRKIIEKCYERGEITVACAEDDPNTIIGFMAASESVLHYVYVKHMFRKMKIAESLVKARFPNFGTKLTQCTHIPRNAKAAMVKFKLVFNPYILLKGE